ncbi:MAG: hypothetical protein V4677_10370 [Bacteroidota bacterium]
MKPCSSTIVFFSVVVILFMVTLVTILSSRALPQKSDIMAMSANDNDN